MKLPRTWTNNKLHIKIRNSFKNKLTTWYNKYTKTFVHIFKNIIYITFSLHYNYAHAEAALFFSMSSIAALSLVRFSSSDEISFKTSISSEEIAWLASSEVLWGSSRTTFWASGFFVAQDGRSEFENSALGVVKDEITGDGRSEFENSTFVVREENTGKLALYSLPDKRMLSDFEDKILFTGCSLDSQPGNLFLENKKRGKI